MTHHASTSPSPSLALLTQLVAELVDLQPEALVTDTDIIDQGLDSVRLMMLVERLRDRGADIDFLDMTQFTTLEAWAGLLEDRGFEH